MVSGLNVSYRDVLEIMVMGRSIPGSPERCALYNQAVALTDIERADGWALFQRLQ